MSAGNDIPAGSSSGPQESIFGSKQKGEDSIFQTPTGLPIRSAGVELSIFPPPVEPPSEQMSIFGTVVPADTLPKPHEEATSIFDGVQKIEPKEQIEQPTTCPTMGESMFADIPIEPPKEVKRVFRLHPFVPDVIQEDTLAPYMDGSDPSMRTQVEQIFDALRGQLDDYETYIEFGIDSERRIGMIFERLMAHMLDSTITQAHMLLSKMTELVEQSLEDGGFEVLGVVVKKEDKTKRKKRLQAINQEVVETTKRIQDCLDALRPLRESIRKEIHETEQAGREVDAHLTVASYLLNHGDQTELSNPTGLLSILTARAGSLGRTRVRILQEEKLQSARTFINEFTSTVQEMLVGEIPAWTQAALLTINSPRSRELSLSLLEKLKRISA